MRKKLILAIQIFCISIAAIGCGVKTIEEENIVNSEKVSEDDLWLPQVSGENEILLYNYYNQQFVTYDSEKKQVVSCNSINNYFQYCFNVESDIYTSGHSLCGQYKILEQDGNEIKELYKLEDSQNGKIYPCGADKERNLYYFIEYFDKEETERKVVQYRDGELYEFTNTSGYIMPGMLLQDTLYYTLWNVEREEYDIYMLNINNYDCEPQLYKEGVENCDLFYCNSNIYAMSNSKIYNLDSEDENYDRCDYNYFDSINNILIQISPNTQTGLNLFVTDLKTGEREVAATQPVSYEVKEGELVIYCEGEIVNYKLKG